MEIVIAAAVLAAGLVIAALLLVKRAPGLAHAGTASPRTRPASAPATKEAAKTEADDALAPPAGDRPPGGAAGLP